MILFKKTKDLCNWLDAQHKKSGHVGFVPTMGALHQGHISLIEASKKSNGVTISSIFVNPTQFNDPKDFEKYPVTIDQDIYMLEEAGCDVVFLPSVTEIYPAGKPESDHYNLGYLETILDGKYRPGHFQGVCTVVHRLLDIVNPDNLYLGQKDYQQCMVIKRLLELTGKSGSVTVNICPTLRETDGLAMSSRNMRLSAEERKTATAIFQCLRQIKNEIKPGNLEEIKKRAENKLKTTGIKPDYVEIADAGNLTLVENWDGRQPLVALIAAFLNEVRLIDNMTITG